VLALLRFFPYHRGLGHAYCTPVLEDCEWLIMIDSGLLAILCCPETKQSVSFADAVLVGKLNEAVARGGLKNKGGRLVSPEIDGGLIRADHSILYPIREGIPVMLIEEGIPLDQLG
jgi:uncharacterized protein